jgi:hypothetical protein
MKLLHWQSVGLSMSRLHSFAQTSEVGSIDLAGKEL